MTIWCRHWIHHCVAKTPRLPCPRNTTQWPPGPPQQDDTPVAPCRAPQQRVPTRITVCAAMFYQGDFLQRGKLLQAKETYIIYNRRKFRSLTSDNMQSWKSRVEMSSQQKEDQHACRVTRKKYMCERNVRDVENRCVFQWFVVPDVRKVASRKRRVRR